MHITKESAIHIPIILKFKPLPLSTSIPLLHTCLNMLYSDNFIKEISVHWNIPNLPLLEDSESSTALKLLTDLKARISSGTDQILTAGYASSIHPVLTEHEAGIETAWARTNPMGSGVSDIFHIKEPYYMPAFPDTRREGVYNEYLKQFAGFAYIHKLNKKDTVLIVSTPNRGYEEFTIFNAACYPEKKLERRFKQTLKHSSRPVAIIADISSPKDCDTLEAMLMSFMQTQLKFPHLKSILIENFELSVDQPIKTDGIAIPASPLMHKRYFGASLMRESAHAMQHSSNAEEGLFSEEPPRITDISIPTLASMSAWMYPDLIPDFIPPAQDHAADRIFVANMQGYASLTDNRFSFCFSRGRFAGIARDDGTKLSDSTASTYFCINGQRLEYSQGNAFSFESPTARGLRETLHMKNNYTETPGTFWCEYYFVDNYSSFFISFSIQYPKIADTKPLDTKLPSDDSQPRIECYAPLEIPLFTLPIGEKLRINCIYPDRSYCTLEAGEDTGTIHLAGECFSFIYGNDSIFLGFPRLDTKPIDILPVKTVKGKHNWTFYANIGGSYQSVPIEEFSGYRQDMSVILHAGSSEHLPADTKIPDNIAKEVLPTYIS